LVSHLENTTFVEKREGTKEYTEERMTIQFILKRVRIKVKGGEKDFPMGEKEKHFGGKKTAHWTKEGGECSIIYSERGVIQPQGMVRV